MNTEFKQTRLELEQYLPIFVGSGFSDWHLLCNISSLVANHNQYEARIAAITLPLINQARELYRVPMVIQRLCCNLASDSASLF